MCNIADGVQLTKGNTGSGSGPRIKSVYQHRLRELVREYGALPSSFHLRGMSIAQFPSYGGGFSVC
jgi:hypothetical protein